MHNYVSYLRREAWNVIHISLQPIYLNDKYCTTIYSTFIYSRIGKAIDHIDIRAKESY